ncbi:MAG: hypothetical protein A3F84_28640 [Candidatus Handelsmanbacteria bacterium RIFCSPLOWO2_12_FULL_64_10]|uniref:Lipoprotein n=1 Tax=Handelsmanbacteria sp. (strain RIFCSPLOWO2_12_FULL_64_10) TaxID=1817868 RepID=A0A1F6D3V1_HANXR|nr:MAG: hypothetical protein A3F84_28640 [Candidatus Handelsmanbacteria bacterium RIFCSPLOWO2_12_FULL_64_10]
MRIVKLVLCVCVLCLFTSCAFKYSSKLSFPAPDEIFMTTGDGDIQKPYTPLGQVLHIESGTLIPIPLICLASPTVDPDVVLRTGFTEKVKQLGGNGVINMRIDFRPPKKTFLGALFGMVDPGQVTITGTVIRR